jgi:uncharacterized coiled-coil protein SlyX
MMAHWARDAAFVAGLALLSGFGVTQSQLDAQLNQRMAEMHSYVDQKVGASESATRKDLADVKASSEALRASADAALKAVQSQGSDVQRNRETLAAMLEAQSQALDQQKRTVDALIERLKAAPLTSSPVSPAPAAPTPPGPTTPRPTTPGQ